jgi:hypothetical protein
VFFILTKILYSTAAAFSFLFLSGCSGSGLGNPEAVVDQFYTSYLENASTELLYGSADKRSLLSPGLRQRLQGWLPESSKLDPLTCTAAPTGQVNIAVHYINKDMHSYVLQHSSTGQLFTVDLIYISEEGWLIDDVHCPQTPEGAAYTFFTWYNAQLQPGSFLRRSVRFADIDYRAPGLLTAGLVERLEAVSPLLKELDYLIDPFFMVRDRPGPVNAFSVTPDYKSDRRAHLEFTYFWNTPEVSTRLILVRQGDTWQIDNLGGFPENTPEAVAAYFFDLFVYCLTNRNFYLECYQIHESDYLSPTLFEQLSAGEERPSYSDLLRSKAFPVRVILKESHPDEDRMLLVMDRYYDYRPEPLPLYLVMEKMDGLWRITGIQDEPPSLLRENP